MIALPKSSCLVAAGLFCSLGHAVVGVSQVPQEAWDALNQSVNGNLAIGRPLALPCYLRYSNGSTTVVQTPDAATCTTIQQNKNDPVFISDHFGGYISYNFAPCVRADQACSLSAFLPIDPFPPLLKICYQGCVPSYYVDAHTVKDVQNSLEFAREQNVTLVVKNTGHDYRGRSNAPDSFAIW